MTKKKQKWRDNSEDADEEFDICYGDPNGVKKRGLYFKLRWKGYGPSKDTWEPVDGLSLQRKPQRIRCERV